MSLKDLFDRKSLKRILSRARRKRIAELKDDLDNVLFLDYDGVVSLEFSMELLRSVMDKSCIENVNKLCKKFDLKIVVISSWKNESYYQDMLYEGGLDKDIEILGKTDELYGPREEEVKKYLEDHIYIDKFVVLDDRVYRELRDYQVKPDSHIGFDEEKYNEAVELLKKQRSNK